MSIAEIHYLLLLAICYINKMNTFYICRHGETENNLNRKLSGWIDTPLTDKGLKDARKAAERLETVQIDQIFTSDLGRAFMSGYIIARHIGFTQEIFTRKDFREVNYGSLSNKPYDSYPKISPEENSNYIPEGGESLAQMQQRVLDCIYKIALENIDKTTLIVAHDGTINSVKSHFNKVSIGETDESGDNPNGFIGKFTLENETITSFESF